MFAFAGPFLLLLLVVSFSPLVAALYLAVTLDRKRQ